MTASPHPLLDAARPKVSIAMITYNQEQYVGQAIESVLAQRADFRFEVVIGDDVSADRTPEIIARFRQRHPEMIRVLETPENLGANRNLARTIEACRGEYIALLEGDDYWTASHKLQRQATYLDAHPGCSTCFHNALVKWDDDNAPSWLYNPESQKPVSTVGDILKKNFIATATTMFRRGLFGRFPDWFFSLRFGDWPLHILNAQHGNIGYIDEVMSVYRKHGGGLWSGLSNAQGLEQAIEFCKLMDANLNFVHRRAMRDAVSTLHGSLATAYSRCGEEHKARASAVRSLRESPANPDVSRLKLLRLALRPWVPRRFRRRRRGASAASSSA